jgi:replication-associated recombination protein RarA
MAPTKERPRLLTRQGHELDVAASALQKSIRRSAEDDAVYWAVEIAEGGYPAYAWRRLKVITSEDVGLGWTEGPAVIDALHRTWLDQRKERGDGHRLALVHAVILLARAKKSRLVGNACVWAVEGDPDELHREPPDVALDRHTKTGRARGRGMAHFLDEAALLADPESGELTAEGSIPDPYLERAHAVLAVDR